MDIWKRAWADTCDFFGWNKKSLLLPILWLAGAVVFYFWQGLEAVTGEIFVAIAFGLIPVGAFAILLLIWNLIRAPIYIKWAKEKEECKTVLEIIGGIENDIYTGKILLEKLKHSKGLNKYLREEYDSWYHLVGEFLQKDQYPEFFAWFNAAYMERDAT
jgi:hypothetical protein